MLMNFLSWFGKLILISKPGGIEDKLWTGIGAPRFAMSPVNGKITFLISLFAFVRTLFAMVIGWKGWELTSFQLEGGSGSLLILLSTFWVSGLGILIEVDLLDLPLFLASGAGLLSTLGFLLETNGRACFLFKFSSVSLTSRDSTTLSGFQIVGTASQGPTLWKLWPASKCFEHRTSFRIWLGDIFSKSSLPRNWHQRRQRPISYAGNGWNLYFSILLRASERERPQAAHAWLSRTSGGRGSCFFGGSRGTNLASLKPNSNWGHSSGYRMFGTASSTSRFLKFAINCDESKCFEQI